MMRTTTDLADYTQQIEALRAAGDFTNYALAVAKGVPPSQYPQRFAKAAVDLMTTGNSEGLQAASMQFVDLNAKRTLLGAMRGSWIPAPPFTAIASLSEEPDAVWVGEGQPAPVVRLDASSAPRTDATKLTMLIGLTKELADANDGRARAFIERRMLRVIQRGEDRQLLSDDAAVEHLRPAGLLHGLSPISSGPPGLDDTEGLWTAVRAGDPERPFYITSPRGAQYLAGANTDGTPTFPNASPLGTGSIAGVPLLTSPAAGNKLILVDAAMLAVFDEGVLPERADHAAVLMDDAASGGAAQLVSGWQTNTVFLRFTRFLNWVLAVDDAVAYLELPISGSPA